MSYRIRRETMIGRCYVCQEVGVVYVYEASRGRHFLLCEAHLRSVRARRITLQEPPDGPPQER